MTLFFHVGGGCIWCAAPFASKFFLDKLLPAKYKPTDIRIMINTRTLALNAIATIGRYDGNLEEAVIARVLRFKNEKDLSDAQANALYFQVLEEANATTFQDRAQYVKEIGDNTEKWYDPMNDTTYWVTNRDFNNAKAVR